MQPLYLKVYDKKTNTIHRITGYELVKPIQIKVYDEHYSRTYSKGEAIILRCAGIKDYKDGFLYEGDNVCLFLKDREFRGTVTFVNGAFVCEGQNEIITEWPNPQQIAIIGNFFLKPVAANQVD